jgi:hypothetical protein
MIGLQLPYQRDSSSTRAKLSACHFASRVATTNHVLRPGTLTCFLASGHISLIPTPTVVLTQKPYLSDTEKSSCSAHRIGVGIHGSHSGADENWSLLGCYADLKLWDRCHWRMGYCWRPGSVQRNAPANVWSLNEISGFSCMTVTIAPQCTYRSNCFKTGYGLNPIFTRIPRNAFQHRLRKSQDKNDRHCTCNHNTEARSCNHCSRGKAISITYSGCVFIALGI